MGKFIINGGKRLNGTVPIKGAKNSVLALMAAAILTNEKVRLRNVPNLSDVNNMIRIIRNLGADVTKFEDILEINPKYIFCSEIPRKLAKELRSSVFLLGSILSRTRRAKVAYPGGCDIGLRPIDMHIKGLQELNVKIVESGGYIYCDASKLRGNNVILDYPSVGATENIILAAVKAKGTTTVMNAAREPEIVDLQNFLCRMGAKIEGAGSSVITIEGVSGLRGADYRVMPDRIVAGTLAVAVAMTGGEVTLCDCNVDHLNVLLSKLNGTSLRVVLGEDSIHLTGLPERSCIEYIDTQPYPGFPTDMQAQMTALQTVSKGVSVITENIFENRFKHVSELTKMGASIKIRNRSAIIRGVDRLTGTEVFAKDLRGGAALVLAGLNAYGTTVVNDVHHIDRGYEGLEVVLKELGADIVRV